MWDQIEEWHLVLPPSRPDFPDLSRVAKLAKQLDRNSPVAILGSTPEFRDLLCELRFSNVFVFDKSKSFHLKMNTLMAFESKETFVHGDWLETLANFSDEFVLILSDLTSGNIPYNRRDRFYELIERSLQKGGWFVDKVLTNERSLLNVNQIRQRYRNAPVNLLTANYFSCEALFCSELQIQHGVIDTTKIYAELAEKLDGPRFTSLQNIAKRITPPGCFWYYGRPWEELSESYCSGLQSKNSFQMSRHLPYWGRARQFFWQRA
jgi:hypothetical protein